jgi:cholesterol transport system auxiliary component
MKILSKPLARGTVLLFSLCSGCVSLERSYPEKRYFVIEVPRGGENSDPAGERILTVANLRISPRYADRGFVYRTSDAGYESDFYNQFLSSPDTMISEELRKGLAASHEFKYVLGPSDPQQPNYVLEGSVNALYGDFRNVNQPTAVLEMDFFLYKENSPNPGIVTQKRYVKSVPLSERSPQALVKGWDQALQEIVAALANDLKSANL